MWHNTDTPPYGSPDATRQLPRHANPDDDVTDSSDRVWPSPVDFKDPTRRATFYRDKATEWHDLALAFPQPSPKPRWQRFGTRLYTVVAGTTMLFGYGLWLMTIDRWPPWAAWAITGTILIALLWWAQAVVDKDRKYRAQEWQRAVVRAWIDACEVDEEFANKQRISNHLLMRMAFVLRSNTFRICMVTRDHPIHLLSRIWIPVLVGVGSIVGYFFLPSQLSVNVEQIDRNVSVSTMYVLVIPLICGLIAWYLSLKWWYWAFLVTDEHLYLVRVPPKWFPWMKDEASPLRMSSLREAEPTFTRIGNMCRWGGVSIGTDMPDSDTGKFADIRWIGPNRELAGVINDESHRDADEGLTINERILGVLQERLPDAGPGRIWLPDR